MDIFKGRNQQAIQTAINRAKMYNPSRPSEVNKDGVVSNNPLAYNSINKKSQGSVNTTESKKN
jgi:hypothetical protein